MPNPYFDPNDYAADLPVMQQINATFQNDADRVAYSLRVDMGPQPFDGDVDHAKLLLLMHNPGYGASSTPVDHAFWRDGWPISSFHPDAPPGMRDWYMEMFRPLVDRFGPQHVAARVALVQMVPWASGRFHYRHLRLPSAMKNVPRVKAALGRGALVLIGYDSQRWHKALGLPINTLKRGKDNYKIKVTPNNLEHHAGLWDRALATMA